MPTGILSLCAFPLYLTPRLEAAPDTTVDPVVRAAQAGDADAFASLYDAHVSRIYALCLGLAGNREDAAELVQDTFVRAWERLRTFRGECALSTWLHRVAVNIALESRRSQRRRSLRVAIESDLAAPGEGNVRERDAAAATGDVALAMDLETAIARLPAGARAVFALYDIGGYSHAEIAERLQIAEGTSKAHLFRARRLLRGMLDR